VLSAELGSEGSWAEGNKKGPLMRAFFVV